MNLMTNSFMWNSNDFFRLYGYQPLPPGRKSRAAVVQFAPADDVGANVARIAELCMAAIDREKPDLIVFPELSLSGLGQPASRAEPMTGKAVAQFVKLAMKLRVHLVAGVAEQDENLCYNTAVLVGPEGLVGSYRKIHLNAADKTWASAGAEWRVFDLPIGRVGLLIGHDAMFPEAVRSLSLLGCDLVACPAAVSGRFTGAHGGTAIRHNYPIPTGADPYHWHAFRVRGGESNVYFAFANVIDTARSFRGGSAVFGPDSFVFPRQESAILEEEEGFAAALIDTTNLDTPYPTNVVRRKDLVAMRLPHHYAELIKWHQ
jgi:predicted amidohydrolase